MHRYVLKRIILLIPVLLGVSMLVYCILDLAPGDAADILAPDDATLEEKEALRVELGLNRPVLVRYFEYMWKLLHGDLGESYLSPVSVWSAFTQKAPNTLKLGLASVIFAVGTSLPLGIYAARHRGSWKDAISMILAILGLSMPNFWLGLLLMLLFALRLGWLPSGGADMGLRSLILPTITIGTGMMATLTRTTRSSMLDVIRQDYLRTARAKGVTEEVVIKKHALKNALIPIITIIGTMLGGILGGATLTESVFSWPGVGRLIIDSLNGRDTPVVTGCIIMTTMFFSVVLLAVDLIYAFVDPRIKAQYASKSKKGGEKKDGEKAATA